jgi:hypothetical protein
MAIDFTLNKGTVVMIGTMPMKLKSDTVVEIEANSMDHVAEMFATSAGPRTFGEHLAKLAHREVKHVRGKLEPWDDDDEDLEVDVDVSYGAFGARQEKVVGKPRRRTAPPEPLRAASPVEERFVPTPEGVAPGRYPLEIQTATDPPLADPIPAPAVFVAPAVEPVEDPVIADPEPVDEDLPEGFPGLAALKRAGITKWSEVADYSEEDLREIDGIGPTFAEQIIEAVEKHRSGEDVAE